MYVHIGNNCVINENEIVGVFDIENTTVSKKSREFLNFAEKSKKIINVSTDIPRSFVVCFRKSETFVFLSQLTAVTILKRTEKNERRKNCKNIKKRIKVKL